MEKNKFYYYIVAQSEGQAKFVTEIDNSTKTVLWNKSEKPLALAKSYAEDLVYCLNLNGYATFVLQSYYEIEHQIFIPKEKRNEEK